MRKKYNNVQEITFCKNNTNYLQVLLTRSRYLLTLSVVTYPRPGFLGNTMEELLQLHNALCIII